MHKQFNAVSAHAVLPGVTVLERGVIFSVVFREASPRGILLFRLSDGMCTEIPLTDEHRFGCLYSVKITGLVPAEWGYLYYLDNKEGRKEFEDPYARGFVSVSIPETGEKKRVCRLFPVPDDELPVFRSRSLPVWEDQFLYSLHVKGFTMDPEAHVSAPGTFRGAAEKIPYLRSLGVTGVLLQPVYEPRPGRRQAVNAGTSLYWWYGESFYFAPREEYSGGEDPMKAFAEMVNAFHDAGMLVLMQVSFPETVSSQTQSDVLRFYVTHYGIDGFRLIGHVSALPAIVTDPILADTLLLHDSFPYENIRRVDTEHPERGIPRTSHLADCSADYSRLVRSLVKSDDYCMPAFAGLFTETGEDHGRIRYICGNDGFTLRDLVSYNEKHNDANGEGNRDGENDNRSWNCGQEGETDNEEVLRLRRKQARNFLTLLFMSQGTPLLHMGDERWNTRGGNNNPYRQDNPIGWMNWEESETEEAILEFVRRLSAMRREHPILRMSTPFRGTDYLSVGYPDLSLHGAEAWRPRIDNFSHTLGWLFCEAYAPGAEIRDQKDRLLYVGINTYWREETLALPRLPAGCIWDLCIDTADERGFLPGLNLMKDRTEIRLAPRSVVVLCTRDVTVRKVGAKALWNDRKLFFGGRSARIDRTEMSPRIKERLFRLR